MKHVLKLPFEAYRQTTIDLAVNTYVCESLSEAKRKVDFNEKVEDDMKSTEFEKIYKKVPSGV